MKIYLLLYYNFGITQSFDELISLHLENHNETVYFPQSFSLVML